MSLKTDTAGPILAAHSMECDAVECNVLVHERVLVASLGQVGTGM
jgi:hypothetical protein